MSDELNYTPAPDYSQQVSQAPADPQPQAQPQAQPQHEIYDPPIEHDPIGQALIGLPIALATGIGEGVVEGAGMLASVGKEVLSWGAGELGIGAGEGLLEGGSDDGSGGAGGAGGGSEASEPDATVPDASSSGDYPQSSADDSSGGDGQDGGVCEPDQGDGGY